MRRTLIAAAVLVPALALTGCGGSSDSGAASPSPTASAASPAADAFTSNGVSVSGEPGSAPTITVDSAQTPPSSLVVEEITKGDGKKIGPNSIVSVQYAGVAWSTGQEFDSSWANNGGQPIEFPLKGVITGWQQGLEGVTEGSRVLLNIPPDLAYGEAGSPPVIGPNETLVFVVDVEEVKS
jgi:FKBP-type peptidyl-prolyl cis-trans isomerase